MHKESEIMGARYCNFRKIVEFIPFVLIAIVLSTWDFRNILHNSDICCQNYGTLSHSFYLYPHISVAVSNFLKNTFGTYMLVFVGQVLIPALSFYFIVRIFNRYLNRLWSLSIGFVSILSFQDYPFRKFLIELFLNPTTMPEGSKSLPIISNFPIPSLSVFTFLVVFFYSTKLAKLDIKRLTIFTILWSAQMYVNALDAMFGACFWFAYITIRLVRKDPQISRYLIPLSLQVLVFFLISLPSFLHSDFSVVNTPTNESFNVITYSIIYFAIPVFSIIALLQISKIDIEEILFKFWHIYLLLFVELLLMLFSYFFQKGFDLNILINRIPMFFLHFYYYLPIIFYASREYREFRLGVEGNQLSNTLRRALFFTFHKASNIYLPIIIALVILFSILSSNNYIYK